MKKWIQLIWLFLSVGVWTAYLIIRYGIKGAEARLDVELKEMREGRG